MFKSNELLIDEHGLKIIKNARPIEHIDYIQIDWFEIKQSHIIRNRLLVFLIGTIITAFFVFSFIYILFNYSIRLDDTRGSQGLLLLWVALFSFIILGASLIISVFIKKMTLHLKGNSIKNKRIDINSFQRMNQIEELKKFLSERIDFYNTIKK